MRSLSRGLLAAALAFSTTACLDLDVVNENAPDLQRALKDPADVEEIIASAFRIYMSTQNSTDYSRPYPQLADELTTTISTQSFIWSREPRETLDNNTESPQIWIPRRPWDGFSECAGNTRDGLRVINGIDGRPGLKIMTIDPGATEVQDNTERARAWAHVVMGLCHGTLGLIMDQVAIATEETEIPAGYDDQVVWEVDNLTPHNDMIASAIKSLEKGIAVAEAAEQFIFPVSWVNEKAYTNADVIQLAHTLIARFLVYSPRTAEQRAAVDWDKVLFHTQRGLTYDFGPTLASGIMTSGNWLGVLTATSSEFRMDNMFLGPADQSGQFKKWLQTPFDERLPFFMVTSDRRVTGTPATSGTTACTEPDPANWLVSTATANNGKRGDQCSPHGAYFRNRNSVSNFSSAQSTGYRALYQWHRRNNPQHGAYISSTGHYTIVSEAENRLFRAEALLRKGGAANVNEAIRLINITRTKGQWAQVGTSTAATGYQLGATNLPAIPETGDVNTKVPTTTMTHVGRTYQSCVPRSHANVDECGNVWDALIWERKMELTGQDAIRSWADFRGLNMLQPGTLLQMPIPGRYLVGMKIPIYTYGGVGGQGAATTCVLQGCGGT